MPKPLTERFIQIKNDSAVEFVARCRCWEWEAPCGCRRKECAHPDKKKLRRYYEIYLNFFEDEKLPGNRYIVSPGKLLRIRLEEPCQCRLRTRFRPVPLYQMTQKGNEKTFIIRGFAAGSN